MVTESMRRAADELVLPAVLYRLIELSEADERSQDEQMEMEALDAEAVRLLSVRYGPKWVSRDLLELANECADEALRAMHEEQRAEMAQINRED